ncbi:MAG: carboxypeptidase-like regulatory domain-containing protein [Geothrix sp.]|nr:carboxypeptidase-like regulatory domain-containing protein [Geothrix sp.]
MTIPALCLCLLLQQPQAPLPASASLSGTTGGIKAAVQTPGGTPVAGVEVRLRHRDGRVWTTLTNEKGHFQAGGLPPGEYQIESRRAGFRGEVCPIQIKAQAWLLGVPKQAGARREPGTKTLRFHGPAIYESGPGLLLSPKRPERGKIPMH